ncbi:Hpt domain-containing protein [Kamptonema sp. UHCC 0994]|uniref:Hpt domain-containing protein n=1 Tax=Kamptonema sp. UHCC 0994 TaxID=3031329 RepID=UPI0023BB0F05|nr:Hpt domain-containing protein [Kamptonema sp. UHCC 0994]MDF0556652.1 Hpt domain-containing protein [Kamptonema sp. UHCC 0994]
MLPEQLQRIIGYFVEEATEHIQTIEIGFVNLQSTVENSESIHQIIRSAHSIKGGAAMLGFSSIQRIAHRLEDYFKTLRECPLRVDSTLESLLLQIVHTLAALIQQVSRVFGLNQEVGNQMILGLEPIFEELNTHLRLLIPTRLTIRATTDDQVYILSGYCLSLARFSVAIAESFHILGGTISRQEQDPLNQRMAIEVQLQPGIRQETIRSAVEFAGGIIGTVQTQQGFSLFAGPEYTIRQAPLERPQTCIGCRYYYGRSDGGYLLNCTVHPQGPEEENCRDRETD